MTVPTALSPLNNPAHHLLHFGDAVSWTPKLAGVSGGGAGSLPVEVPDYGESGSPPTIRRGFYRRAGQLVKGSALIAIGTSGLTPPTGADNTWQFLLSLPFPMAADESMLIGQEEAGEGFSGAFNTAQPMLGTAIQTSGGGSTFGGWLTPIGAARADSYWEADYANWCGAISASSDAPANPNKPVWDWSTFYPITGGDCAVSWAFEYFTDAAL